MSTAQPVRRRSEGLSWGYLACFLAGILLIVLLVYVTRDNSPAGLDREEIKTEVARQVKQAIGEYPNRETFLEIIREEVAAEKRHRIEWERKLIEWGESIRCHCGRRGVPGVPGAVGAAPEASPPDVEK